MESVLLHTQCTERILNRQDENYALEPGGETPRLKYSLRQNNFKTLIKGPVLKFSLVYTKNASEIAE